MNKDIRVGGTDIRIQGRLLRIACLRDEKWIALADPAFMISALKDYKAPADLFTFIPKTFFPVDSPKYAYFSESDNIAALPITTFDQWWNQAIDKRARAKVRKSEKSGIVIRRVALDESIIKGIVNIFNECPVRQGRRFPHYRKDIEIVRQEISTFSERSTFLGAYIGEELIGFTKVVSDETGTQAGLLAILSMVKHWDKAPNNALLAEAVRLCGEKKFQYLWYGRYTYGNKVDDSLTEFKCRNGFQCFYHPRYYVPLTMMGKFALQAGLQKRFVDRLPVAVTNLLRDLRRGWYSRKMPVTN